MLCKKQHIMCEILTHVIWSDLNIWSYFFLNDQGQKSCNIQFGLLMLNFFHSHSSFETQSCFFLIRYRIRLLKYQWLLSANHIIYKSRLRQLVCTALMDFHFRCWLKEPCAVWQLLDLVSSIWWKNSWNGKIKRPLKVRHESAFLAAKIGL